MKSALAAVVVAGLALALPGCVATDIFSDRDTCQDQGYAWDDRRDRCTQSREDCEPEGEYDRRTGLCKYDSPLWPF